MAARKKQKSAELTGQSDPRAPLDSGAFLAEARPVLAKLTDDLLARADASPAVTRALEARHAAEQAAQRTAESFVTWRRSFVDQVAAAWLLSCVFVRTLEDRGLVGHARLAGPGAADSQRLFLELAPSLTERDSLLATFRELCHLPAAKELFDPKHNPVWLLAPSADAAKALLQLFRAPHADAPAFRFGQADTRFLGDLYQDLNDDVKKRYALLQTPRFVESFILDRTLERAIERFGLEDTTLIDPTCGSGHFLLGAFERLVNHRLRAEPGLDVREAARRALDRVFGADINPYAVAIARFRLTLAFLERAGYATLLEAPALPLHVVVADSLLHNPQLAQLELGDQASTSVAAWKGEEFALEDEAAARDVLHRRFGAVVGNPPYITVKDPVLRERYRKMYTRSAAGKYSVAAPFTERFFQLGREGAAVGMITANSFMKREFGKKLIEEYLPTVNLDLVINTSGAYIPGHGTPTVLLFGTCDAAKESEVHVVLASRGEPSTPEDPEQGLVWRAIADHWNDVGFENDYVTVVCIDRATLSKHPWSLGGGGASELKELLESRADKQLSEMVSSIGFMSISGEDEAFVAKRAVFERHGIPYRGFGIGEEVRDWVHTPQEAILFPYDETWSPKPRASVEKWLWPLRTTLANRAYFGERMNERGLQWFEYVYVGHSKLRSVLSLAFAFVATHNHFVLDRGGKVFNRSAPVIKLRESATEDDHYALLAYLNSSTACFWMKQVFYPKATSVGDISVEKGKPEANRFEFAGTGLADLPLPPFTNAARPTLVKIAKEATALAAEREELSAARLLANVAAGAADASEPFQAKRELLKSQLVALQERLDWLVYELFGLCSVAGNGPREASSEERPFHRAAVLEEWRANAEEIQKNDFVRLIEDPVNKRLWLGRQGVFGHGTKTFTAECGEAAIALTQQLAETMLASANVVEPRDSLLARLVARLEVIRVAAFLGEDAFAFAGRAMATAEAVPYLASYRLGPSGIEKHGKWQNTWALQRREDAAENVGEIPVPPKYDQKDYRDANYWRLRGKLDVPKERFISYPGCESDEDGEPVYGWAGWDHAQRARALGSLYYKRKTEEGWKKDRLTPMLAGLLELLPWLHQWHAEPDEEYGGQSPARYFQDFLDAQCAELGLTHDDLNNWRPAEKTRTRGAKRTKALSAEAEDAD